MIATTSVDLPKPVLTDLTMESVITRPIVKDWVRGWLM